LTVAPAEAVDALPSNVQSNELPLLVSVHLSGPLTVNLAVGTTGATGVTVSVAVADTPPADAVIGTFENVPPTARVFTVNVAVVWPAGTVTLAGTVTGSLLDRETTVPAAGAGEDRMIVPVTGLPPTTLGALKVNPSAGGAVAVTVIVVLAWLPLIDAAMVAEPAATPVTVKLADVEPAATFTDAGTAATPALLLDRETVEPVVALSVTDPCAVPPGAMLVGLTDTPVIVSVVGGGDGGVVLFPPH
jgi:hypothetical protein